MKRRARAWRKRAVGEKLARDWDRGRDFWLEV